MHDGSNNAQTHKKNQPICKFKQQKRKKTQKMILNKKTKNNEFLENMIFKNS